MLDVTSRLRKAQEETGELGAKSVQQRAQLHQAESRAEDARRRLGVLRQGAASATTAAAVLGQLQREVRSVNSSSVVYVWSTHSALQYPSGGRDLLLGLRCSERGVHFSLIFERKNNVINNYVQNSTNFFQAFWP